MSLNNIIEGYVYVLYNPIYETYGEMYKIGQAIDLNNRLSSYSTSYPEESEIKYSITHKYYKDIEKIVHLYLKDYRMNNNRDFFKCSLELIKDTINKVKDYDLEDISKVLNKSTETILYNYNIKTVNEPINLSKENIIRVYDESKEIINSDIMLKGVKTIVKIFIEKICTNKDGKLLIECIDKVNHKYRYTDKDNKVVTVRSSNFFLLIDNYVNIKNLIWNTFLKWYNSIDDEDYGMTIFKNEKKRINKNLILGLKTKFNYNLLDYFI